ncbi:MAG: hypothetical protein ABSD29_03975 [Verrucomicrobiota bacterium]|jgi:hypothetical protein
MNEVIWNVGSLTVLLTTYSPRSRYGIPVLRVRHPKGDSDLGPTDLLPKEGQSKSPAAVLLLAIHAAHPLTGKALEGARQFLRQWPDGPQLP